MGVAWLLRGWNKFVIKILDFMALTKITSKDLVPTFRNTRLSSVLERLQEQFSLSEDGANWLLLACDPFHDFQRPLAGYPDSDGSRTVCQKYVSRHTISIPDGCTGLWQALIMNWPVTSADPAGGYSVHPYVVEADGIVCGSTVAGQVSAAGPLSIYTSDDGEEMFPGSYVIPGAWAPANYTAATLHTRPEALDHKPSRVVAQGFEVHNVTPEVNKGGSVITGSIPQLNQRDVILQEDKAVEFGAVLYVWNRNVYRVNEGPQTVDAAVTYPNSKTWNASEGTYNVITFNGVENPITPSETRSILVKCGVEEFPASCWLNDSQVELGTHVTDVTAMAVDYPQTFVNTNGSFAFFHGLTQETILEVTFVTYTEYAPRAGDALLPMATPSPHYDVKALRLYSEIISRMPPACPVDMNAKGEWARIIAGITMKAAQILLPMAGAVVDALVPGALPASLGLAAGAGVASRQLLKRKKKKTNKKQKKPVAQNRARPT